MKVISALIVTLVCSPGCQAEDNLRAAPTGHSTIRTADIHEGLDCEPAAGVIGCIRLHGDSAAKAQNVTLSSPDGVLCLSTRLLPTTCFDRGPRLNYGFLGREGGYLVIAESLDSEGVSVVLIEENTGKQLRIDNPPLFAPSEPVFATVAYDSDAGYGPNRVAVWDATTSKMLYEVNDFAPGTGPSTIQWTDTTTLKVTYSEHEYPAAVDEHSPTFLVWRTETGEWTDSYPR